MNKYSQLAKQAISEYLKNDKIIDPPVDFSNTQAGVFVSLHTKSGELRGCIGTYLPQYSNLAEEIINNAIAAAVQDNRFSPLTLNELENLEIGVDVLSEPVKVNNLDELDPKKFGVIVKSAGGRSGLLLPNLTGVDTVKKQLSIACQKAGIVWPDEQPQIFKFTVERHDN